MRERRMLGNCISTSEKVNSLSDSAALLYTWTIPHLDDDGRGDASVFYLKGKIVPMRDWTKEEIKNYRQEIINVGLMLFYSKYNHEYWAMPKEDWVFHQRGSWQGKHHMDSKIPPDTENDKKQCSDTPTNEENGVLPDKGRKGNENKKEGKEKENDFPALLTKFPVDLQDLILQSIDAVSQTRKGNKVAESVKVAILEKFLTYEPDQVKIGINTYLDKKCYKNNKDENYLFGIIRNTDPNKKEPEEKLSDFDLARKRFEERKKLERNPTVYPEQEAET